MTDRPIIFSAPMVRALMNGKTQTRRVVTPQPELIDGAWYWKSPRYDNGLGVDYFHTRGFTEGLMRAWVRAMPHAVGDRLWVREAWRTLHKWDCLSPKSLADDPSKITFEADPENRNPLRAFGRYRHAHFMPRWASRLTLLVTDVRVQRVRDITRAEIHEEGLGGMEFVDMGSDLFARFETLWNAINEKRGFGWNANPWVYVDTFEVVKANIDRVEIANGKD